MPSAISVRLASMLQGESLLNGPAQLLDCIEPISGASDARKRKGFFAEGIELLTATTTAGSLAKGVFSAFARKASMAKGTRVVADLSPLGNLVVIEGRLVGAVAQKL